MARTTSSSPRRNWTTRTCRCAACTAVRRCASCGPTTRWRGQESVDIGDLNARRLLVLNADDDVHQQLRGAMRARAVQPQGEIETTYSSTICALAAAGSGVGVVNAYIARVFSGQLAIRPFTPRLPVQVSMGVSGADRAVGRDRGVRPRPGSAFCGAGRRVRPRRPRAEAGWMNVGLGLSPCGSRKRYPARRLRA
ncbi:LysR substrate-binding domain-containing protein [Achromobacter marplatensis]|uniref:LysR substrate-binding domain-containing protein n=1 Tax=Achromobacter marplatensis TaxID=470868 RepID=UPI003C78E64E